MNSMLHHDVHRYIARRHPSPSPPSAAAAAAPPAVTAAAHTDRVPTKIGPSVSGRPISAAISATAHPAAISAKAYVSASDGPWSRRSTRTCVVAAPPPPCAIPAGDGARAAAAAGPGRMAPSAQSTSQAEGPPTAALQVLPPSSEVRTVAHAHAAAGRHTSPAAAGSPPPARGCRRCRERVRAGC
jgi:hypothetical protein